MALDSEGAAWYLTAKPLAIAHDGFNEKPTNQLSAGSWAPIFRGGNENNSDHHVEKRLAEGTITNGASEAKLLKLLTCFSRMFVVSFPLLQGITQAVRFSSGPVLSIFSILYVFVINFNGLFL